MIHIRAFKKTNYLGCFHFKLPYYHTLNKLIKIRKKKKKKKKEVKKEVLGRVDVIRGSLQWWNCRCRAPSYGKRVCDSLVGITLSCRQTQARPSSRCLTNTALIPVCFLYACMHVWYCVFSQTAISICVCIIEVCQGGCIYLNVVCIY